MRRDTSKNPGVIGSVPVHRRRFEGQLRLDFLPRDVAGKPPWKRPLSVPKPCSMIQRCFATSRLNLFCQALGGWFRLARNTITGFQALPGKRRAVRLTGTGLVRQNTHRRASLEQVRQMGRFAFVRGPDARDLLDGDRGAGVSAHGHDFSPGNR